jgi:limonene-1,2-epoxide hydrolase
VRADRPDVERRTRQTVERYLHLTEVWENEAMLAMWAEDGVLDDPEPIGEFRGIRELATHYRSRPAVRPFDMEVLAVHVDGRHAIVEFRGDARRELGLGDDFQFASVFTVDDDGKIAAIVGYRR